MRRAVLVVVALLFGLTGCSLKVDSPQVKVDSPKIDAPNLKLPNSEDLIDQIKKNVVSCSASLASAGAVTSGQAVAINVTATGGVAPYRVSGVAGSFTNQTTISRSYTNNTTSNVTVSDVVTVMDSFGLTTQCDLSVTVSGSSASTLACAVDATPTSPKINDVVTFAFSASGGNGTYTFSGFSAGANSTITSALSSSSNGVASAAASYNVSGAKTASVTVTDGASSIVCSKSLTVRPTPSVALVASPSASVSVGNSIAVTATPTGFNGTPSYVFSTNESGIGLSSSESVATVSSSNGLAHASFSLTVTATSNGESASATIALQFTSAASLTCYLTHSGSQFITGDTVNYSLWTASGESLEFTEFKKDTGAAADTTVASTKSASYSTSGWKYAKAKARSKVSGVACNGGAVLQDFVFISKALACDAYINPNPAYTGDILYAYAYVAADSGVGSVWLDQISANPYYQGYLYQWVDDMSAEIYFLQSGSVPITFTVKDSAGHSATCNTIAVLYDGWW